jgi:hypothetical protein
MGPPLRQREGLVLLWRCYVCCTVVLARGYLRCHCIQVPIGTVHSLSLQYSKIYLGNTYGGFLSMQAYAGDQSHVTMDSQSVVGVKPHLGAKTRFLLLSGGYPDGPCCMAPLGLNRKHCFRRFLYCCHGNMFTVPLPSNSSLFWLCYSTFQVSCQNIKNNPASMNISL